MMELHPLGMYIRSLNPFHSLKEFIQKRWKEIQQGFLKAAEMLMSNLAT